MGYLITPYLHRAWILSRYTTHIPRRLVSFSIPRGIHILLAFVILSFALSSYTVAGLLCRWSLAGARVFGWHFPFDSLMAWPNLFLLLLPLSIVLVGRFCTGNYHFSFLFSLILSFRFFFFYLACSAGWFSLTWRFDFFPLPFGRLCFRASYRLSFLPCFFFFLFSRPLSQLFILPIYPQFISLASRLSVYSVFAEVYSLVFQAFMHSPVAPNNFSTLILGPH